MESRKESGVAVILNKERSRSLMSVRLSGRLWNLTLIQVYAPTNQAEDQEKENFYTCLQQVYRQVTKQKHDIVLLSGDFNAKIGSGTPIGKLALWTQNDNGERFIQFTQANDLVAANAMVRRHVRQMYTWKSHDGVHRNQIDFILVQKRWWNSIQKCRSYPSTDADSVTVTTYWLDWETYGAGTEHQPTMHKIGRKFVQCGQCTTVCTIETISCLENERFNFLVVCVRKQPDVVQYSVICALCGYTDTAFHWHPNSLPTAPTLSTTFCV